MNKSKLFGLIALTAVLISVGSMHKAKGDQPILQPHQQVEAAILTFYRDYTANEILIESATVTTNVDKVPVGMNAAEAIAHYKSNGMIIDFAGGAIVIMTTPLRDQPATRTTPLLPPQ